MKIINTHKFLKIIGLIGIILIVIFIGIFLYCKFNFKIITNEKIENATAEIYYSEFLGYDAITNIHYYFYRLKNDNYLYLKTKEEITIKGASDEYIIKKGYIKNQKQLINIINNLENKQEKQKGIATVTLSFYYNNDKIGKDDFINSFSFNKKKEVLKLNLRTFFFFFINFKEFILSKFKHICNDIAREHFY